jgi:hypothetical protein
MPSRRYCRDRCPAVTATHGRSGGPGAIAAIAAAARREVAARSAPVRDVRASDGVRGRQRRGWARVLRLRERLALTLRLIGPQSEVAASVSLRVTSH